VSRAQARHPALSGTLSPSRLNPEQLAFPSSAIPAAAEAARAPASLRVHWWPWSGGRLRALARLARSSSRLWGTVLRCFGVVLPSLGVAGGLSVMTCCLSLGRTLRLDCPDIDLGGFFHALAALTLVSDSMLARQPLPLVRLHGRAHVSVALRAPLESFGSV